MKETVGQRLKRLRTTRTQFTQEQFADKISIVHNTYVRYENDIRKPSTANAAKIADFYNISVSDLLNGVKEKAIHSDKQIEEFTDEEKQIILEYRKLLGDKRVALKVYLDFLLSEQEKEKEVHGNAAG